MLHKDLCLVQYATDKAEQILRLETWQDPLVETLPLVALSKRCISFSNVLL